MARGAARPKNGPTIDLSKKLVVCIDGPKTAQWFYLDDWKRLRAIAHDMAPYVEHRPTVLDYKPLTNLKEHPTAPGAVGNMLTYQPGWDDEQTGATS